MGAWAAARYVVAAPVPTHEQHDPGGWPSGDVRNQPADVSFVIDEILEMSRPKSGGPLAGLVDKRHIGAAGLSFGGSTVYGLVFNTCCRDKRIDAAVLMSSYLVQFPGGKEAWRHVPALMLQSDADPQYAGSQDVSVACNTEVVRDAARQLAQRPFENSTDPAHAAVPALTIAFWDRYLKGQKPAQTRLVDAVTAYGQADLQRALR